MTIRRKRGTNAARTVSAHCSFLLSISAYRVHRPSICPDVRWEKRDEIAVYNQKGMPNPIGWWIDNPDKIHIIFRKQGDLFIWKNGRKDLTQIKLHKNIWDRMAEFFWQISPRGGGDNHHSLDDYATNILKLSVSQPCWGFFLDQCGKWYCSLRDQNKVMRYSLVPSNDRDITFLGDGKPKLSPESLHSPTAIYVDNDNFDVYIADTGNNRVQLVENGASVGSTFAGKDGQINMTLDHPTGLTMDQNGYLYIANQVTPKILRCSQIHCDCIIGCLKSSDSSSNQLDRPSHLAFNSHGSLFLLDQGNRRIQRFNAEKTSCCKNLQRSVHRYPMLTRRVLSTWRKREY